ncbi:hypothetical protein V8C44DRAFT_314913 [Trichoderma aethiopicum]
MHEPCFYLPMLGVPAHSRHFHPATCVSVVPVFFLPGRRYKSLALLTRHLVSPFAVSFINIFWFYMSVHT